MVFYPDISYVGRLKNDSDPSKPFLKQPKYADIDMLIHADTDKKISAFMDEWDPLFEPYSHVSTIGACKDVRDLLLFAIQLKSLIDGDRCTKENLSELGFSFEYFKDIHYVPSSLPLGEGEVQMSYRRKLRGSEYCKYISRACMDLSTPLSENQLCGCAVYSGKTVSGFLSEGGVIQNYSTGEAENEEVELFFLDAGSFENTSIGFKKLTTQALDELVTVHLYDARAYSCDGEIFFQTGSVVSAIWYCLVDSFREGRAGLCLACGKPFIAFGERGNQRLYCGSACNKKYQRFAKFESLLVQGKTSLEAAKEAGIKLETAMKILNRKAHLAR